VHEVENKDDDDNDDDEYDDDDDDDNNNKFFFCYVSKCTFAVFALARIEFNLVVTIEVADFRMLEVYSLVEVSTV
jgi:hypothetical protein